MKQYFSYYGIQHANRKLLKEIQKLINNSEVTIHGLDGFGTPTLTSREIIINGSAESMASGANFNPIHHDETGIYFTGQKYETCVRAILLRMFHHNAETYTNWDMEPLNMDEWDKAFNLYNKTFTEWNVQWDTETRTYINPGKTKPEKDTTNYGVKDFVAFIGSYPTVSPRDLKDIQKIITTATRKGIKLKGQDGYGKPILTPSKVLINGSAKHNQAGRTYNPIMDDEVDIHLEGQPYTAVIGAIILRQAHYEPDTLLYEIEDKTNWTEAFKLYEETFGTIWDNIWDKENEVYVSPTKKPTDK